MRMKEITSFLEKEGFGLQPDTWKETGALFLKTMQEGLQGRGSLKMLPSFRKKPEADGSCQKVALIDAGGTNLRLAMGTPEKGEIRITAKTAQRMPGSEAPINAAQLFDALADWLVPYLKEANALGFCFSYVFQPQPDGDGKVIMMAKQVQIKGVENCSIFTELNKAFMRKGMEPPARVVVLNDSVAVLLGGAFASRKEAYDDFIGLVLGTGINIAYFEKELGGTAVSLEAGGYDGFIKAPADLELDEALEDPGKYSFEKSVSGRYLGPLAQVLLNRACKAGLFSGAAAGRISQAGEMTTAHFAQALEQAMNEAEPSADTLVFRALGEAVVNRAAWRTAAALAAVLLRTGKGKSPKRPVGIVAEGSTFCQFHLLRERLTAYLTLMTAEEPAFFCFIQAQDAVLLGTAAAVLKNDEKEKL